MNRQFDAKSGQAIGALLYSRYTQDMSRDRPLRAFTLSVATSAYVDHLKPLFGGNVSRVADALFREAGLARGDHSFFGLEVPTPSTTQGSNMRIEIVPTGKTAAPLHHHNNEVFAEVPAAGDYIVRLTNNNAYRVEAVLSVDGIDACSGKDASFAERGYIVEPYQTLDVKGWFRTNAEAAAFTFTGAGTGGGYAEKTGRGTANVGTIDVAVFAGKPLTAPSWSVLDLMQKMQKQDPIWPQIPDVFYGQRHNTGDFLNGTHIQCSTEPPTASAASVSTVSVRGSGASKGILRGRAVNVSGANVSSSTVTVPTSDVTTGYGARVKMSTVGVSFQRATQAPAEVVSLRYATREKLLSWGVPVNQGVPARPNPFPGGYGVPAPTGWTG